MKLMVFKSWVLDKMTIANLGKKHPYIFRLLFEDFLRIVVIVWSYELLFHNIHIA